MANHDLWKWWFSMTLTKTSCDEKPWPLNVSIFSYKGDYFFIILIKSWISMAIYSQHCNGNPWLKKTQGRGTSSHGSFSKSWFSVTIFQQVFVTCVASVPVQIFETDRMNSNSYRFVKFFLALSVTIIFKLDHILIYQWKLKRKMK